MQTNVEVPVVHTVERNELDHQWTQEEVIREVQQTTTREIVHPVLKPVYQHLKDEIVEVPVCLPPRMPEREVHRPNVCVQDNIHYIKGDAEVFREEHTIDVPYVMSVPQVNVVPREETQEIVRRVPVPHVQRVERIIERPVVNEVHRQVEIPQIHTVQTINYIPKFVDSADAYFGEGLPSENEFSSIICGLRSYADLLQREGAQLREKIAWRGELLLELRQALRVERRSREESEKLLRKSSAAALAGQAPSTDRPRSLRAVRRAPETNASCFPRRRAASMCGSARHQSNRPASGVGQCYPR